LATLEKNYQIAKNSPLYTVNKKNFSGTQYGSNNKEKLDNSYYNAKKYFQSLENRKNNQGTNKKDLDEKLNGTTSQSNKNFGTNEDKIKQYLQDNDIQQITLKGSGELLLVRYQNGETKTMSANNQQLREIKSHLQNKAKKSISQTELKTECYQSPEKKY